MKEKIMIKNNAFDQLLGRYETYYFQPCFRVDYDSDKIIRKEFNKFREVLFKSVFK